MIWSDLFRNMGRWVSTLVLLPVFVLSLVFPYSSDFYSRDQRVVGKEQRILVRDKVEVAPNDVSFPAECLSLKGFEVSPRQLQADGKCFIPVFVLSHLISQPFIARDAQLHAWRLPWHPSIVVALRKLII